jgi:hypothetical protein
MPRRFPPPWTVESTTGGWFVRRRLRSRRSPGCSGKEGIGRSRAPQPTNRYVMSCSAGCHSLYRWQF